MAECILLVDDDPLVLDTPGYVLEEAGYAVLTAERGEEALALAQAQPPDLAVLEGGLPDLSGVELCQRFRALSAVPIIFLSARHEESAKIRALDAGGDDYVPKPCPVGEFLARVRAAL